jgi:hypothetical protein
MFFARFLDPADREQHIKASRRFSWPGFRCDFGSGTGDRTAGCIANLMCGIVGKRFQPCAIEEEDSL